MKGGNLTSRNSSRAAMNSSWMGQRFGNKKDEKSNGLYFSSNANILMCNTSIASSQNTSVSMNALTSCFQSHRPSCLQSHRSRVTSQGNVTTICQESKSFFLSEALVTLSDVLSISMFAIIRWWKNQYLTNENVYKLYEKIPTLQLIPKTSKSTSDSSNVFGLKNYGQTCFLNSVIQALASLPPIIAYLENIALKQNSTEPTLTELVLGLLSSIGATSSRYDIRLSTEIDTREILEKVGMKNEQFFDVQQQDAQEFLQALINMIVMEAHEVNSKTHISLSNYYIQEEKKQDEYDSFVPASMRMLHTLSSTTPSPLSGWVGSLLQCNGCHHVRPIQNAPFLDIPLVPLRCNGCTLEQCLSAYSKVERVHNVECHNCLRLQKMNELEDEIQLLKSGIDTLHANMDGLQSQLIESESKYQHYANLDPDDEFYDTHNTLPRSMANKCLILTRLPSILCLHVQRRFYDATTNSMHKSSSRVDFPQILDLTTHCAHNGFDFTSQNKTKNRIKYRLMSAVEHKGNANYGHYQTYRRVQHHAQYEWAFVSDENVQYVDWDVVKACQAYLLFYEAI